MPSTKTQMNELPKIVKSRLASQQLDAELHPDANLLAAFAESSLRSLDRLGVLEHLAVCGDCRAIVALALPEDDLGSKIRVAIPVPPRWRFVRWALVAAGIAVIGTAGLWQYQRHGGPVVATLESTNQIQTGQPAATQGIQTQGIQEKKAVSAEPASPAMALPTEKADKVPQLGAVGGDIGSAVSAMTAGKSSFKKRAQSPAPSLVAESIAAAAPAKQGPSDEVAENSAPASEAEINGRLDHVGRAKEPATTTVQVSAAAPAVAGAAMGATHLYALQKSAPALLWKVAVNGTLQRSLDAGKTWQNVPILPDLTVGADGLKQERSADTPQPQAYPRPMMRGLYSSGEEVWVGGGGGALFHSLDAGQRWIRVVPTQAGVVLSGDIVRIAFDDSQHGTVTTSTPEIWTTSDGGQMWRKQ